MVQHWRPFFMDYAQKIHRIAVWICVPRLPIQLYNERFIRRLGSTIGVMLKIDMLTSLQPRGQFARICVEIDLDKPLDPKVIVRGHIISLEYDGLCSFSG